MWTVPRAPPHKPNSGIKAPFDESSPQPNNIFLLSIYLKILPLTVKLILGNVTRNFKWKLLARNVAYAKVMFSLSLPKRKRDEEMRASDHRV
ncbi:transmembrane protein, putative [Medicago truncatula]|uniref:Transmembrane protein, putative n=1 Tax=Medicago truncatula TaxID=3880 RepID=G7JMN2_MEDTR|nr:transmembrane protein, putative [Medicago truncatula]